MEPLVHRFAERLAGIEDMLGLDPAGDDVVPSDRQHLVAALRTSAVVLIVAYFEGFLRELCGAFVDEINRNPNEYPWGNLPSHFRRLLLFEDVREIEAKALRDIAAYEETEHRILAIFQHRIAVSSGSQRLTASRNLFMDTESNPTSEVVERLLQNLGIQGIFANVLPNLQARYGYSATNLREALNDMVHRRNNCAHGGSGLNVTLRQIRSDIENIRQLAHLLAVSVEEHLSDLKGLLHETRSRHLQSRPHMGR